MSLKFDFVYAGLAYFFALERAKIFIGTAEKTGVDVFCKYNFVPVNIDFNRVGTCYVHLGAHLLGNNDASKLVDIAYNAGGFQF